MYCLCWINKLNKTNEDNHIFLKRCNLPSELTSAFILKAVSSGSAVVVSGGCCWGGLSRLGSARNRPAAVVSAVVNQCVTAEERWRLLLSPVGLARRAASGTAPPWPRAGSRTAAASGPSSTSGRRPAWRTWTGSSRSSASTTSGSTTTSGLWRSTRPRTSSSPCWVRARKHTHRHRAPLFNGKHTGLRGLHGKRCFFSRWKGAAGRRMPTLNPQSPPALTHSIRFIQRWNRRAERNGRFRCGARGLARDFKSQRGEQQWCASNCQDVVVSHQVSELLSTCAQLRWDAHLLGASPCCVQCPLTALSSSFGAFVGEQWCAETSQCYKLHDAEWNTINDLSKGEKHAVLLWYADWSQYFDPEGCWRTLTSSTGVSVVSF